MLKLRDIPFGSLFKIKSSDIWYTKRSYECASTGKISVSHNISSNDPRYKPYKRVYSQLSADVIVTETKHPSKLLLYN